MKVIVVSTSEISVAEEFEQKAVEASARLRQAEKNEKYLKRQKNVTTGASVIFPLLTAASILVLNTFGVYALHGEAIEEDSSEYIPALQQRAIQKKTIEKAIKFTKENNPEKIKTEFIDVSDGIAAANAEGVFLTKKELEDVDKKAQKIAAYSYEKLYAAVVAGGMLISLLTIGLARQTRRELTEESDVVWSRRETLNILAQKAREQGVDLVIK